jgi:hypothetical protein
MLREKDSLLLGLGGGEKTSWIKDFYGTSQFKTFAKNLAPIPLKVFLLQK